MHCHSIQISPSDYPKFNFLQRKNYLSEFKTEMDKIRARRNLGIPDDYSLSWGNISGAIESQTDLMRLIQSLERRIEALEHSNFTIYFGASDTLPLNVLEGQSKVVSQSGQIEIAATKKCAWVAIPKGWTVKSWKETTFGTSAMSAVHQTEINNYDVFYVLEQININNNFLIEIANG